MAEFSIVSSFTQHATFRFIILMMAMGGPAVAALADLTPVDLRCEYKTEPLAIDAEHPRLFWKLTGSGRGERQTAYRILAATTAERLSKDDGDLWDTGQVTSPETIQIPYAGKPLPSEQAVFWKVQVWDAKGKSKWSRAASWTMGLLRPSDWKANWIGGAPPKQAENIDLTGAHWLWHAADGENPPAGTRYFRTTITLPAGVTPSSAKLAISADDRYTVTINDGNAHPGPQVTDSWRQFQILDLAKELHAGANTLLIAAENATTSPAGVIARLIVKTASGVQEQTTDATWESSSKATGPFAPVRVVGGLGVQPWGQINTASSFERVPPPYFRKTFAIARPVQRAVLYATALGVYDLSLNGRPVSNDVLSPGWTDFRKRVHYLAYDVTRLVKPGMNALGAILGDGWYASYLAFTGKHHYYGGEPKLRLQLRLNYADGTTETIGTDGSWKVAEGPIRSADLLMGCAIDTRQEMRGWNTAAFDDRNWRSASVQPEVKLLLESQPNQPIRPITQIVARKRMTPKTGVTLYDLGQNMVGWARLKVTGKAGQTVTVRYGERLNPDGTLYTTNLRSARATDTYILRGGTQTLEPAFTFHGFQYVEVTGVSDPPAASNVVGIVAHSDLASTLTFDSDNPLLNRLVQNIDWGYRGNALDVPTDCPQRDERAGWMGDAQVFAKTALFHRDGGPFYTKWMDDVEDGQFDDGSYPDVAPSILGGGNAAWEDAGVITTYRMFEMYADTEIIRRHWASLTRFMEHLAKIAPDGIRPVGAYGDWLLLDGPQQSSIHGTAYYFRSASLMASMADAIGKSDEATQYRSLSEKIRTAFRARFVGEDGRITDNDRESQTFYALALEWDLVPEAKRPVAANRLREMIRKQSGHLTTGFIGTPVLLNGLARSGYAGESNALLLTETYPSWLYQVKIGATTMWERWDGWTPERGFQDPGMNSFNHYWLGCVGEWIYTGVAGIDTEGPGWSRITVRPHIDGKLLHARCRYDSIRGPIESEWTKRKKGLFQLKVTVPANVTATVALPARSLTQVSESGKAITNAPGVAFVRQDGDSMLFAIGSGSYTFEVKSR